jgi:hypothetical protein
MFQRSILSPFSGLKTETVCFSETLASTDESTQRQNPDHHQLHHREHLKSHSWATSLMSRCWSSLSYEMQHYSLVILFHIKCNKTSVIRHNSHTTSKLSEQGYLPPHGNHKRKSSIDVISYKPLYFHRSS